MSYARVALGIAAPLLLGLAGCVVTPQRDVVVERPREQVIVTRPAPPVVVERPTVIMRP